MNIVIIDYGSGNLHSAHKAFERVVRDHNLGMTVTLTSDAEVVRKADRIV
jgi:glutamine amidotransferase